MELKSFFEQNPSGALAFSGGTDSSLLVWAAAKYGRDWHAYYVHSAFQPAFELEDARKIASQCQLPLTIIEADILQYPEVAANPPDRCYHCKRQVFSAILRQAAADGYSLVIDGTNASDDAGDRPGMKALRELEVRSPLRECGLTKDVIRELSRQAGLFTWDKPAYACLATRIPTGTAITEDLLSRTEWAEDYLLSLGFTDFRVRTLGNDAKLQLKAQDFPLLLERREEITGELKKRYASVLLDLEERK